ncbi:hypothetical protein PsYK624_043730 [Phanerochaete sordida]|uniref:ABM domain-containing protein n=1 Tax=Phanerochaete sordida TaxID=48140 RepID=A0A9P3G677_9APHY|nr:hypothetical protein PsYK624_043730 [Phanerochaete sordida]
MTPPVVGIVKVSATEAYRANPSIINEALAILASVPGTLGQWHGLGIQDPESLYFVNVWESAARREAFAQDTDTYARLAKAIGAAFDSAAPAWRYHVPFVVEPSKALSSPATEFAVWRVKDGVDVEQFKPLVQRLHGLAAERLGADVAAGSWGATLEDPRVFVVCIGWSSIEAYKTAAATQKEIMGHIGEMMQIADLVEAKHAGLTRYSRGE